MSQKILVVDDQLFMLRLIQHTLQKAGYELIPARSSQEARAALKQDKPDLVVGDATVVKDGVQTALNELQARDHSAPIPVICVSDSPGAVVQEPNEPCDGVVFTKPFSPTKLLAEVKRLMPNEDGGTLQ